MPGPLEGISVVEFAGLGPAPFCGMVLADLGAHVIRVDRPEGSPGFSLIGHEFDLHNRGKGSIAIDLRSSVGIDVALDLIGRADIVIEGLRPGVTERLGVGPAQALARNPALVYGRMTGWGQVGRYAATAGHDIDYIAVSGLLHPIGSRESPTIPLNMVGDYGGGGMLLLVGVLAAIVSSRQTGVGQVVDAAMVDGSALLSTSIHGLMAAGVWADSRNSNLLDGAAPFYSVYKTADGRHMAVGALEPQFFNELVEILEVDGCPSQMDRDGWPEMRRLFADRFGSEDQKFWIERFAGSDACVAPVRSLSEAPNDPHLQERSTFIDVAGITQPAPAPRFAETGLAAPEPPPHPGQNTDSILAGLGYSPDEISKLRMDRVVA